MLEKFELYAFERRLEKQNFAQEMLEKQHSHTH